ncbi:MAG TPA: MgtC/SapB family protein [Tissierellaceae bacterium]|nr:MgtC/SapB family protein [Tissierellaceae bacterium]
MVNNWEIIIRIILSSILGGLIGLDRESTNRPAGFRTHTLVSIGSTLIMMVSLDAGKYGGDPSRIAAQVVSGIGFLGAGTILRTGVNIEGLTTAASLWVCAGIGLAVGSGYYLAAIVTTVIVLFFLRYSKKFERIFFGSSLKNLEVVGLTRAGLIGDIGTLFGRYNIIIKEISIVSLEEDDVFKEELHFTIKLPHRVDLGLMIDEMILINGILKIRIDDRLINLE